MKSPSRIKPRQVKANAAELIREREVTQETLAFLNILALGKRQLDEGKAIPFAEAARRLRARRARRK